ncbi:unnamed protein product [Caretta caretta]
MNRLRRINPLGELWLPDSDLQENPFSTYRILKTTFKITIIFDTHFFRCGSLNWSLADQVTVKMKVLSFCPSSAVSSSLTGWIIFFITFHIHKLESAKFRVTGPGHPVTARMGEAIVLPCHLSPRISAVNMEVRWFRSEFTSVVHQYYEGKEQYGKQMTDYHGRTELLKAGIMDGNVSLQILNIRPSDEGQYNCFVQDGPFYEEALLELKVAETVQFDQLQRNCATEKPQAQQAAGEHGSNLESVKKEGDENRVFNKSGKKEYPGTAEAMVAVNPAKTLQDELTCPICLDCFKDLVSLDCDHNFC